MRKGVLGIACLILVSGNATVWAACAWTWDCSTPSCRQVPVCDRSLDLPLLPPVELAPLPSLSIKPIPTPVLPPLGTRSSDERYLCNGFSCRWETVCE